MCGISGFVGKKPIIRSDFYDAHCLLRHRGPDDEGFVVKQNDSFLACSGGNTIAHYSHLPHINTVKGGEIILGHQRLSILDLSWHGHQPMVDGSGQFTIVYNGEIYNYVELRDQLLALGYKFHSDTDTEVFLNAYVEWGEHCLNRLNGMWAVAILDRKKNRIFFSRDRFGIKPLYYSQWNNAFYFASEAKFFTRLVPLTINEEITAEYLANCYLDHREETFYTEVIQFPKAHFGFVDLDTLGLSITPYWSISDAQPRRGITFEEAKSEFDHLFTDSISLRMRSDVSVGTMLSGGLDSTAIVCNLFHHNRFPPQGFHSFSSDFKNNAYSEREFIDLTTKQCRGLIPHFTYPQMDDVKDNLEKLLWEQDFPFRSFSVHAQNVVYRLIKESSSVVVLLNGQGGDELFGGYHGHYFSSIESNLGRGKWWSAFRELQWLNRYRSETCPQLILRLIRRILLRKIGKYREGGGPLLHSLFRKQLLHNVPIFHRDPFQNALRFNLCFSALPEYLRYEDRNSMTYSKESRLPFLDYRLVEWAFSIPNEFKIFQGLNKRIVREAVTPYTTEAVLLRKDKMGFTTPQEIWQRNTLSPLLDIAVDQLELPFLNERKLKSNYIKYKNGEKTFDYSFWWRILCFYLWLKMNRNPPIGKSI